MREQNMPRAAKNPLTRQSDRREARSPKKMAGKADEPRDPASA